MFNDLYAAILIPSALWLPLTLLAVDQSSQTLLWLVRIVLGVVGGASLDLFLALLNVRPAQPAWAYRLAMVGSMFVCIKTVILDALVWGAFFQSWMLKALIAGQSASLASPQVSLNLGR